MTNTHPGITGCVFVTHTARHHCNLCSVISAAWLCLTSDLRHFFTPSLPSQRSRLLLLISSALLFSPRDPSWQLLFGIANVSNVHYWALLQTSTFSFTSGTSKGTSSPLLLRISATIRRVLSLGMTFSSCIFVHTASALRESLVSSEIKRFFFFFFLAVTQPCRSAG